MWPEPSKISNYMLNNTPVLSKLSGEMVDIYSNVYSIVIDKDKKNNEELNTEIIELLLDRKVVTKVSVKKLVDQNKIQISDNSIIE